MNIVLGSEKYIDYEEVAQKIGVSIATIKLMVRAKEIPLPEKLKTRVFWKESTINDFINNSYKKNKKKRR